MLSIALIAFMTLEQVSPAHAATDICNLAGISASDSVQASASNDASPGDAGSPLDEQQQQQRHCCASHTSSTPPIAHAEATLQVNQKARAGLQ